MAFAAAKHQVLDLCSYVRLLLLLLLWGGASNHWALLA
jgi:hypothetical protein